MIIHPHHSVIHVDPRRRTPFSVRAMTAVAALLTLVVLLVPTAAEAAVTRVEAEALPPAPACWRVTEWSANSGGKALTCGYGTQQPLSWNVDSASGGVLRLYGYRDEVARGFRVRVDGGAWTSGVAQGSLTPNALFFTSPALSAGTHRFELEWVSSNGAFSIDYYELESGSTAPPPPPPPPPTPPSGSRVEAESLPQPPACWTLTSYSALSGGAGRTCGHTANAPLAWTATTQQGGSIHLYGYRDNLARDFRVRIDGGAWVNGSLVGPTSTQVLFHSSPALPAGSHRVELEWSSANAFTFDYYEVVAPGGTAPVDSTAPDTTITGGPASTTTASAASFSFTSNEAGVRFECRLDGAGYTPCASPSSYSSLTVGPHTFTVRAIDVAGNVDPTPATSTWQVTDPAVCNISPADGQAAISAAIASCPNGSTVRFPVGASYTQTDKIVVDGRSNLTIDGNGSTFTKTSPSVYSLTPPARPNWELSRNANVTVTNMNVRGAYGPAARWADNTTNQWDHGFLILGGDGTTVRDVDVRNVYGEFLTASPYGWDITLPARNVRVERLTGVHAKRQGVAISGAIGFWLTDSNLSDCAQLCFDAEADITGERLQDIHVLRNTISDFYLSAIGVAGPVPNQGTTNPGDIDNIEIRGNTIVTPSDTCWPAIWAGRGPISRLVVEDNPSLKSQGNGAELNDVVSGSVSRNHFETTRARFGWCNTNDNPVDPANPRSGPTVPVWLYRSSVTVVGNTSTGYGP